MRRALALLGWVLGQLSIAAAPNPPTDAYGDPLPKGATARIGTIRLRLGDQPKSMAFTPDGKRLVATDGAAVAVFDAQTGRTLAYHAPSPRMKNYSALVSPDGSRVVHRLGDDTVGVMELESGKMLREFPFKGEGRIPQALSDDNRWLVTSDEERHVNLWDLTTGKRAHQWTVARREGLDTFRQIFVPQSRTLIHVGVECILLWDVQLGKELRRFQREQEYGSLQGLAVSLDRRVFILERGGALEVWDLMMGRIARRFNAYPRGNPVFTPDGKQMLGGTGDADVGCWDVATGKLTGELKGTGDGGSTCLAVSSDGRWVASGRDNNTIQIWDVNTGKELHPSAYTCGRPSVSAGLLSDGTTVFSPLRASSYLFYRSTPRLDFWDLQGKPLRHETIDPGFAHAFALAPDGATVALGEGPHFARRFQPGPDRRLRSSIRLCDISSGKEWVKLTELPCEITRMGFSPNGRYLIVHARNVDGDGSGPERYPVVAIWERTSPTTLRKIAEHPSEFCYFTNIWPSDCHWVGVRSSRGWNAYHCDTGGVYRRHPTLTDDVQAASPGGRVLVACNLKDKTTNLLELTTGQVICKLEGGNTVDSISVYAFSPDGKTIAGERGSTEIVLWDVFTGKEIGKLEGHRGGICSVAFTPGGRLVSGSTDITILVWDCREMLSRADEPLRHTAERLEQLWLDLQAEDAARGYRAVAALVRAPDQAVELLRMKMVLPTAEDQRRVRAWIDDLGNDRFAIRSRATAELRQYGELAEPAIRLALCQSPSLENRRRLEDLLENANGVTPRPWVAMLRAFDALEWIATAELRVLLEAMSKGDELSLRTQEARRTLARLTKRVASEKK